jgi:hypothetical protein
VNDVTPKLTFVRATASSDPVGLVPTVTVIGSYKDHPLKPAPLPPPMAAEGEQAVAFNHSLRRREADGGDSAVVFLWQLPVTLTVGVKPTGSQSFRFRLKYGSFLNWPSWRVRSLTQCEWV